MRYEEIMNIINNTGKGTIHTMTYGKELKTRKGVTAKISKKTVMQIRMGVDYDHLATTIEGRKDGTLPPENAGLNPSLKWVDKGRNFLINTKTGRVMLRVAYANGNPTKTQYYKDGVPVEKADIEALCLKSEIGSPGKATPSVINISIDKIMSIK